MTTSTRDADQTRARPSLPATRSAPQTPPRSLDTRNRGSAFLGLGSKAVLAVLILGVAFLWLEMLRLSDNYLSANASATFEDVLGGFALAMMVTILATLGAVAAFGEER